MEGVPGRFAGTCRPLRERLPNGTAAAVQCSPNTSVVSAMAYYLMESGDALRLYQQRMKQAGAPQLPEFLPEGVVGCWEGEPAYDYAPGGYVGGIGCFVQDGRANLRVLEQATACRQLKVGSTTLKLPVMYAALTGSKGDIQRLYDWAMRQKDNMRVSGLTQPIERPSAKRSPNCAS